MTKPILTKTNNLKNPLGIDNEPKFGWKTVGSYMQSAYRILVSSNTENITQGIGDMWDSGKVTSFKQFGVKYCGKSLSSSTKYYWRVMTYDTLGKPSDWSDTAEFETAILTQDEWTAKLIGGENARLVRSTVVIPAEKVITSARVYASSPGYFELHVNGRTVGDHVLDPVQTNPDMRLLYPTFDVTDMIHHGENAVGARLGFGGVCGLTGSRSDELNHESDAGSRYFIMQLHVKYSDGTSDIFVTDENWRANTGGGIIFDNLYGGEVYDATKEIDGWDTIDADLSDWQEVTAICGKLMTPQISHIKAVETITPVSVNYIDGTYIFDLGKNVSARPVISVSGKRGTVIEMHFAEKLYPDGTLDIRSTRRDWVCKYTLKGSTVERWHPIFAISGFRYISVSGSDTPLTAENIKAEIVTSDVHSIGTFNSSSEMLNKIHDMYLLSQLANISTGVPVDCPHRERLGWLGDAMLVTDAMSRSYDIYNMYMKWFDDMNDETVRSGTNVWRNHIPNPSHYDANPNPFDVPWYAGNIEIPWTLYKAYGDKSILEKNYERMKALAAYLQNKTENYLITERGAWGDWVSVLGRDNLTSSYLGTGYYYRSVHVLARIANILGRYADADKFNSLADKIKAAINAKWLNGSYYDTGTQSANAMALDFGIVPPENESAVLSALTEDIIKRDYHMTTGVTGTYSLFRVLAKYGKDNILYGIMTRESFPSYGYMLYCGATTPWEFWHNSDDAMSSWNHTFLVGPADAWLNNGVAGITPIEAGYRKIRIKPAIVGDLTHAKGSFESVYGMISSEWQTCGNKVYMSVEIPSNTTAEIYVPTPDNTGEITVNSTPIWKNGTAVDNANAIYLKTVGESTVLKLSPGKYAFVSTGVNLHREPIHYDTLNRSGVITKPQKITDNYTDYGEIDFTGVSDIQISLKAKWGPDKRALDFRLDSPDGKIAATLYIVGTRERNPEIYHTMSARVTRVRGVHRMYMTRRGECEDCAVEWIKIVGLCMKTKL